MNLIARCFLGTFVVVLLGGMPEVSALYSRGDGVVELTGWNAFQQQVLDSLDVWIVEFYAPWCGHCKNLAPTYKKVASNLNGVVKVGAVDCDNDANKPLCGRFGVQGFPTLKVFPGDRTGDKKFAVDYQGPRTAKDIAEAGTSRIPGTYVKRLASSSLDAWLAEKPTIKRALLFSNKPTTSNVLKSLALHLKDRLLVGEVLHTETQLVEKYKITSFPTLLVLTGNAGEEPVVYKGATKYAAMLEFLEKYATVKASSSSSSSSSNDGGAKEKPKPPPRKPFDATIAQVSTQQDLNRECLDPAKAGVSVLCVFAILPPLEPEFPESVQQHKELVETLTAVKKHFYDQADPASATGSTFPSTYIFWLDGSTKVTQALVNRFGLSSDLPSLMVVSPKKKAYRPFVGVFAANDLKTFLSETVHGRGRVFQYNWDLTLGEEKKPATTADDSGKCTKKETCDGKPAAAAKPELKMPEEKEKKTEPKADEKKMEPKADNEPQEKKKESETPERDEL